MGIWLKMIFDIFSNKNPKMSQKCEQTRTKDVFDIFGDFGSPHVAEASLGRLAASWGAAMANSVPFFFFTNDGQL